jgi:hypothetical protein
MDPGLDDSRDNVGLPVALVREEVVELHRRGDDLVVADCDPLSAVVLPAIRIDDACKGDVYAHTTIVPLESSRMRGARVLD